MLSGSMIRLIVSAVASRMSEHSFPFAVSERTPR
jgi:hypothetical protein